MQGIANDIALLATLETLGSGGYGGFDADIFREMTQKSLNAVSEWCKDNGLRISILKTHSVIFTWKRMWNFSVPLKVNYDEIDMQIAGIHKVPGCLTG